MAVRIVEFFGYEPLSDASRAQASTGQCPFLQGTSATDTRCTKPKHGSCSLSQTNGDPIICCPNRLYADGFAVLRELAQETFGGGARLMSPAELKAPNLNLEPGQFPVALFGRHSGRELPLPRPAGKSKKSSNYFVDWILARLSNERKLIEFMAVEVQTIDTSGTYRDTATALFSGLLSNISNSAGMNWENVNKRILPQLIYKGHVLGREDKCTKGLFFLCPDQVLQRILDRLGDNLLPYPLRNGTITFRSYVLGSPIPGSPRPIVRARQLTTTVDQVAVAFVSPTNLPNQNVYEAAIAKALAP